MKTASDPRHLRRIKAFKSLFAQTFSPQNHFNHLSERAETKIEEIDPIIQQCAPEWPIGQINKIDLAILRLAIYELLYKTQTPPKVIIDEAVEIAKRYGGQSSSSFVNGALASALKITKREI